MKIKIVDIKTKEIFLFKLNKSSTLFPKIFAEIQNKLKFTSKPSKKSDNQNPDLKINHQAYYLTEQINDELFAILSKSEYESCITRKFLNDDSVAIDLLMKNNTPQSDTTLSQFNFFAPLANLPDSWDQDSKSQKSETADETQSLKEEATSPINIEIEGTILEALARYYMDKNKKLKKLGLAKTIILLLNALASMYLYITTGYEYANCDSIKLDNPDCDRKLAIQLMVGSACVNAVVTWNTTKPQMLAMEGLPEELKPYLKNRSTKWKNIAIMVTAAISAIPMAAATAAKKGFKNLSAAEWAGFGITLMSNGFIHTLPIRILIGNDFLSNTVPFYFKLLAADGSLARQKLRISREKATLEKKIIDAAAGRLRKLASNVIYESKQPFSWRKLQWNFKLADQFKNIYNNPTLLNLIGLIDLLKTIPLTDKARHNDCMQKIKACLNGCGRQTFFVLVAAFVNLGIFFYYVNNYINSRIDKIIYESMRQLVAWVLSSGPNFLLFVMIAYFGGRFGRDTLYKNIVDLFQGKYRLPEAFLKYPKYITLLMILFAYFAYNSRGTSLYLLLIHKDNILAKKMYKLFEYTADGGSLIFNFKNVLETLFDEFLEVAQRNGEDDETACFKLNAAIKEMAENLDYTDRQTLISELSMLPSEDLEATIDMSKEGFDGLVDEIHQCQVELNDIDEKLRQAEEQKSDIQIDDIYDTGLAIV